MDTTANKYDPNVIIQAASDALGQGGTPSDLARGQMIFQQALMDWTDDAREGVAGDNSNECDVLKEAVATLWIAYAQFLANAKQFKSAMDAYEQAITEIPNMPGRLYLEYARFAEERAKYKTAQDVYIRALVRKTNEGIPGAIQDEQDRQLLWHEFLQMMQNRNNPDLTLFALQHAIEENEAGLEQNQRSEVEQEEPLSKRLKVEDDDDYDDENIAGQIPNTATATTAESNPIRETTNKAATAVSKTHVVLSDSIELEATKLLQQEWQVAADPIKLPADIMAAWMVRDGNDPPQPPDPPLFQSSPPKLSDPTAKDILGIDMAIKLIQRLLNPSGNLVLEVCHGLWTLQALKHKETATELDEFDHQMLAEHEKLEEVLAVRLSNASTNVTLKAAVEQMNHNERSTFQSSCSSQRVQLLHKHAWEFRQVQYVQQMALSQLHVPGFTGTGATVDAAALQLQSQICKYLHSAFYIRNRMGIDPHESMLKNQLKRLEKELHEPPTPAKDKSVIRNSLPPTPTAVGTHSPVPVSGSAYDYTATANYQQQPPPSIPMDGQQPQYIIQPTTIMASAGGQQQPAQMMGTLMDYQLQQQQYMLQQQYATYQPGYPPPPQQQTYIQQPQYYYPTQQQQQPIMMTIMPQQQQQPFIYGQPQQQQQPGQPVYPQQQQQQQYPYYQQ